MLKLDEHEVKIVRELTKNPRSSDNAIAKKTKIPVMTVNRKRKKLEERGFLQYFTHLKTGEGGTHLFHATQLYIIQLKSGYTRSDYLGYLKENRRMHSFNSEHILESYLGEQNGRLALMMILKAETQEQMTEIFNGVIISNLKRIFGEGCVANILTMRITLPVRIFHNYLPWLNMEKGKLKEDWPDEWIFVDVPSEEFKEMKEEFGKLKKIGQELDKDSKLKQYL